MEGVKMLKALMVSIIMAAMLFSTVSSSRIVVGGSSGWDVSSNLTSWSNSTSIYVNDTLQFIYTPPNDVIEVSDPDFSTCNTSSPIAAYKNINGETLIIVTKPGPRYFVSSRSNHCSLGLKLRVDIMDNSPMIQPNTSSPIYPDNRRCDDRIARSLESVSTVLTLILLVLICSANEATFTKFVLGLVGFFGFFIASWFIYLVTALFQWVFGFL